MNFTLVHAKSRNLKHLCNCSAPMHQGTGHSMYVALHDIRKKQCAKKEEMRKKTGSLTVIS